jgi:hypothetical protein
LSGSRVLDTHPRQALLVLLGPAGARPVRVGDIAIAAVLDAGQN